MPDNVSFRSSCPIATTLDIVGDKWSLLILRDMVFQGACHFGTFLASEERIASNVLAERLARLVRHGLLTGAPDPDDRRKIRYILTEKGWAIVPTMLEMVVWAAEHENTAAPPPVVAAIKADREAFIAMLRAQSTVSAPKP